MANTETVRVYHPQADASYDVPVADKESWQQQGWRATPKEGVHADYKPPADKDQDKDQGGDDTPAKPPRK